MLEIRKLTINDTDAQITLLAQLWIDKPIDRTAVKRVIEKGLNSGSQTYICAIDGGKLIGYASLTVKKNLWLEANSGVVDELVVDRAHRNRGVGKMLMAEIERIAKDSECKQLDLESAGHRIAAHEFYEELGFEKCEYSSYYFAKEI